MSEPVIHNVMQGTAEWHALRCGVITGSIIANLITPTGKVANNDKSRSCLADLLAQRITGRVDHGFVTGDMQRGTEEEPIARALYAERYAPVKEVGFITREIVPGITIGCSPDGLVGNDGGIEIKSRRPKVQMDTILSNAVPSENIMQVQTALLVTGRAWWDFVSYSNGMPLVVIRCYPDAKLHEQIYDAVVVAEGAMASMRDRYNDTLSKNNWHDTPYVATEIEAA